MILRNSSSASAARVPVPSVRILLVEDNVTFAGLLVQQLSHAGFVCERAVSVEQARQALSATPCSAIVLDLGLPEQDGRTLLNELRSHGDATPVLIASARNRLSDRVDGLRDGADDYLAKPFAMDELIARLHALLRRPSKLLGRILSVGNVTVDSESRHLMIDGHVQPMRPKELAILELLMRHAGTTVARRVIDDLLFGIEDEHNDNTLEVYVHRLRAHLAGSGATARIHTIRGVGYLMTEGPTETVACKQARPT